MKKTFTIIGLFFLVVLIILSVPSIVSILMEWSWMDIGTQKAESWMSFWGGYLGAIIGIIGAITATTIQIKSQTNQIVLAAKENDKLERKRINLNLKIEKNVELFKYLVELKSTIIKYDYLINTIFDEQIELIENYSDHIKISTENIIEKFKRNSKLDEKNNEKFKRIDKIVTDRTEKIILMKNELNHSISSLQALSTSVLANNIFINNTNIYYKTLENYIDKIQSELIGIKIYIELEGIDNIEVNVDERKSKTKTNLNDIYLLEKQAGVAYTEYMKLLIDQIENSENDNTPKT